MDRRKIVLFVLLALTVWIVSTGCGAPAAPTETSSPPSGDSPASADSGEIVIWAWSESEINGLAEKFNQVYPDIKVKFVPVESSGYLAKLQNALITGGEVPDVTLQEIDARGAMFALDAFENLEAAPYNFDRSIVFPQILPTMTNSRDEVLGIERELNPSGICYKRDLAAKYLGTDDPDELAAKLSDWDKFIAEGERIAQETGGKVQMVAAFGDMQRILQYQYNAPIFEGDTANVTDFFTTNLGLLLRMIQAGMMGKLSTYDPAWNASFTDTENYIIYPCAPWSPTWIIKANDPDSVGRWGITSAPVRGYNFGGTAYGILKSAKNKDLAWKFISWATTTEEGTRAAEEVIGAIVSRQATYADGFTWEPDPFFNGQIPNAVLMEKAAPTMEIRPMSQYDVALSDTMSLVGSAMLNNPNMTLEEAVQMAIAEVQNKLPAEVKIK